MDKEKKTNGTEDASSAEEHLEICEPATEPLVEEEKDEELRAWIDRLQRLQAEFENYKKRVSREMATLEERISDRTIQDVLELYDNLERAFTSYASDQNVDAFVAGVEKIFGQFSQFLEQRGIERIETVGKKFDPALHEATISVPCEEEKNTILEEFLPGYIRDGRVLRVSKVSVSQGPAPNEEGST